MKIVPVTLKQANAFVAEHHRHNRPVIVHCFSVGLEINGTLVGIATAARPLARLLDDGRTLEIRRVCVLDGIPNACSKLISRVRRIGQLMGYTRIITYTLASESGASLRAVGAELSGTVRHGSWAKRGKARQPLPTDKMWKKRWELIASVHRGGATAKARTEESGSPRRRAA